MFFLQFGIGTHKIDDQQEILTQGGDDLETKQKKQEKKETRKKEGKK